MGGVGPWVPPLGICTAAWDPAVALRQVWGRHGAQWWRGGAQTWQAWGTTAAA